MPGSVQSPRVRRVARKPKPKFSGAAVVISVIAFLGGGMLVRFALKDRGAAVAPADAWQPVSIGALRFESPVTMGASSDMLPTFPPSVRDRIESARMAQGGTPDDNFLVLAIEMTTKAGTPPDAEGAVRGAISNAASSLGSLVPIVSTSSVRVGELEGYRASNIVHSMDPPAHLHGISAIDGQTVWCVSVMHRGSRCVADAERLLASVRVVR